MPNEWNSHPAVTQSTAQPLRRKYITAIHDKSCKRKSLCTSATIANNFILLQHFPSPHIIYIQLVEHDVFAVAAFQKHLPSLNNPMQQHTCTTIFSVSSIVCLMLMQYENVQHETPKCVKVVQRTSVPVAQQQSITLVRVRSPENTHTDKM